MQVLYPGQIENWRCWFFVKEGKRENQEKNLWNKARTNKKHVTYDTGQNRTRTTLVSGWRALLQLRQPCWKIMLQKWAAKLWALKPRSNCSDGCLLFNFRFVMVLINPLLENIFSNSLIMHQAQRKEILTVTVYGYRIFINIDIYDFMSPFSPQTFRTMFDHISEHLEVVQCSATTRIFNSLLGGNAVNWQFRV